MKNLILLTLSVFLTLSVSAADIGFGAKHIFTYPVKFEIEHVRDNCPEISGQAFCQAIGSVITITAKLNSCVDSVVEFDAYTVVVGQNNVEVHILAMAEYNPLSPSAECIIEKTITKKISTIAEGIEGVSLIHPYM